jgi:hypothetical protein
MVNANRRVEVVTDQGAHWVSRTFSDHDDWYEFARCASGSRFHNSTVVELRNCGIAEFRNAALTKNERHSRRPSTQRPKALTFVKCSPRCGRGKNRAERP